MGEVKTNPFVYRLLRIVLFIGYKVFFQVKFYGTENVPDQSEKRGVILTPNHSSFLDPPLVGISLKRRVTYLAKEYLFRAFLVGWTLRSVGALPILTRTDDFRSLRVLIRILREGNCVVFFPEGTRSHDGGLREAESGVGFLAMKSAASVVPVYIQGAYEAFPRGSRFFRCRPIRVYYGRPFVPALDKEYPAETDPYRAIGQKIMAEIRNLKEKAEEKR